MSDEIPLGKKEDLHLEFKSADSLKDPEKIAREVVAMLNADGGEVWVGLGEEEERAVLVESIPDVERESRRLHDYLVDVIEPPPDAQEVRVIIRESDEGKNLLCIETMPSSHRKPYAFLRKGGRFYVTRVGARIRPMTREEILSKQPDGLDAGVERAELALLAARKEVLASGRQILWLRFEPGVEISLDIQSRMLEEILQDPRVSGNRFPGWNFASFLSRPRPQQDALIAADEGRQVTIRRDGGLIFDASLTALLWQGEENEIWPLALLEYIVSSFRISRSVYREALRPQDPVAVDLALAGGKGWKLRAGTPGAGTMGAMFFRLRYPIRTFTESADLVLTQPLTFRFEEIDREPDRCGYRLIERVYEAFGIRREDIPNLFDSESGRLVLPE
jgi:hypothetical protein